MNNIMLKKYGKKFPLYILDKYRKHRLDPIAVDQTKDLCNMPIEKGNLRKYQQFVVDYIGDSDDKNLLIYHGLGSGKTATVINIYNALYKKNNNLYLVVIIKAALKENWEHQFKIWLENKDSINKIHFVSYDSSTSYEKFNEFIKNKDNILIVIEESHNFIRTVYNNQNSRNNTFLLYDKIREKKKKNNNINVICLSGTPIINRPYELALLFNLLRHNIFPTNEAIFNELFMVNDKINKNRINLFQRRILGLISFYYGYSPEYFASKKIYFTDIKMTSYQDDVYSFYSNHEKKKGSMFRSFTRQACNFVFPNISNTINGYTRPRISNLGDQYGDNKSKNSDLNKLKNYMETIKNYIHSLTEYYKKLHHNDKMNDKYTINDDISLFIDKYRGNVDEFIKNKENKRSSLFISLYNSSPKFIHMILKIISCKGACLVYSNYVLMEGLQIFSIFLDLFGFNKFDMNNSSKNSYAMFLGKNDALTFKYDRYKMLDLFNDKNNNYGDKIKVMLISPSGAEGIDVNHIMQIHIMEPYWENIRIEQVIGRALRQCSHKYLKIEERHVDVYRYKSISSTQITSDQYINNMAAEKFEVTKVFTSLLKDSSIDCQLNLNHNKRDDGCCNCFQFDENKLFDENVGPAYIYNIYDDMYVDSGSNSTKSQNIKTKVYKIEAAKYINDNSYSEPNNYWYNPETNVVYDYELYFPVGKLLMNELGIPSKFNDYYIINHLIL